MIRTKPEHIEKTVPFYIFVEKNSAHVIMQILFCHERTPIKSKKKLYSAVLNTKKTRNIPVSNFM